MSAQLRWTNIELDQPGGRSPWLKSTYLPSGELSMTPSIRLSELKAIDD